MMMEAQNIDGLVPSGEASPDMDRMMERELDLDFMLQTLSGPSEATKHGAPSKPLRGLSVELNEALAATQPQLDQMVASLSAPSPSTLTFSASLPAASDASGKLFLQQQLQQQQQQQGHYQQQHQHQQHQHQHQPPCSSPLIDLGSNVMLFDDALQLGIELPSLSHCTAPPYPTSGYRSSASPAGSIADSVGSRGSSVEPGGGGASDMGATAAGAFDALEECLSSDDGSTVGGYNSDSSGGESYLMHQGHGRQLPSFDGEGFHPHQTDAPSPAAHAAPAPAAGRKGGAARSSARARTAATKRSSRTSKAAKVAASPVTGSAIASGANASATSAALAAANKKPRKGWKCSCAFLVNSITQRERTKLLKAGVVPPPLGTDPATLTKQDERILRSALRKIRNVASAQKSRRNQKEYIAALELEATARDGEISSLEGEVETLAGQNRTLLSQLAELRTMLMNPGGGGGVKVGTGAGGTALLMIAVCCGIGISQQDPSGTAAAAAAGFGFSAPFAPVQLDNAASINASGGGDGGDGAIFTPHTFKSRTLMSVADYDDGIDSAAAAAASAFGGWSLWYAVLAAMMVATICIAAVVVKRIPARASSQKVATETALQPNANPRKLD